MEERGAEKGFVLSRISHETFNFIRNELFGQCVWPAIAETKQRLSTIGPKPKIYYLELFCASEGTLSRWSRLHLQSSAPTNRTGPAWVHGEPLPLGVIHKESLCRSGDINRLMIMKDFVGSTVNTLKMEE
jgi:hypothetical protein